MNKFLVFDENNENILTDSEYSTLSAREDGFVAGIADSKTFNKVLRQATMFSAAFGKVLSDAGYDVSDSTDFNTLCSYISTVFKNS